MIEVYHVTKKYGLFKAVDDLSLTANNGRITILLGPNGAGKSTTMNIMTGCLAATSGEVTIGGYDIFEDAKQAKRLIGYLPEQPPLYLDRTPWEYLTFVARAKGVPQKEIEGQIHKAMEATGIGHVAHRLIKNLSKGYRQRVGFACALLGDPEVIILDEPTVGLDPRQIIDIRELIKSLGKGHTVILSSHILSEVSAVCDHILILSKGKLVASDTPEGLGRRMQRTNVYDMLVQGEPGLLRELLKGIQGLRAITTAPHESGFAAVHLETDEDTDPRAQVFRLLAGADCPIMELQSAAMSLEDVFLELTGRDRS